MINNKIIRIIGYFFYKIYLKIVLIIILFILLFLIFSGYIGIGNYSLAYDYEANDITIVSSYFRIKSKHSSKEYLKWINNFMQINFSLVFYIDYSVYNEIRKMRSKKFQKKTIWIKINISNLDSYKYFFNEFNKSHEIDIEKRYHNTLLYLIWAEKCNFLKKAAIKNYFKSKCFYWVDAGCFRRKNIIKKYINWPSRKKCFEDGRIIFNEIRKPSEAEKKGLLNFNKKIYKKFQEKLNVDGSIFGGQIEYIIKFKQLYYETIKLFKKHNIFIGKDQNLYAYISYFNTDIVKLLYSGIWFNLQNYLN